MMYLKKPTLDCDLGEAAVDLAAGMIGVLPQELVIYCSKEWAALVQELVRKYGCSYVLIPEELMASVSHWAIMTKDLRHGVWSPGA